MSCFILAQACLPKEDYKRGGCCCTRTPISTLLISLKPEGIIFGNHLFTETDDLSHEDKYLDNDVIKSKINGIPVSLTRHILKSKFCRLSMSRIMMSLSNFGNIFSKNSDIYMGHLRAIQKVCHSPRGDGGWQKRSRSVT